MIESRSIPRKDSASTHNYMKLFRILGVILLLLTTLAANTQHARAGAGTLIVNSVGDGADANAGDGLCATASGVCTLRAALEEADSYADPVNIYFNIPGSGVHVISPKSGHLPGVFAPINLDATTQPNCTVPCIVLNGANLSGPNIDALDVYKGATIKGFSIVSWSSGYAINMLDNNTIQSNYIGLRPDQSTSLGNRGGIEINGSNNLVGGPLPGQRNIVSNSLRYGFAVGNAQDVIATSNIIQNNYIGTDPTGTKAMGNKEGGIILTDQTDSIRIINNLISGNKKWGIRAFGAANTVIQGNKIGTDAGGTGALGNDAYGILSDHGAHGAIIGGSLKGQANIIAFNKGAGIGVWCPTGVNNRIQRNSIFSNARLGIDLEPGDPGVTINDTGDADIGPNNLQNFPVLSSATSATRMIKGKLNSTLSQTYTIEFFSSPAGTCDPFKYGEGKKFIGAVDILTNASGNAFFNIKASKAFTSGEVITATATDSSGNTSEFSACQVAK